MTGKKETKLSDSSQLGFIDWWFCWGDQTAVIAFVELDNRLGSEYVEFITF
jgi:hypothetical protein